MTRLLPAITIAIEWENASRTELDRTRQMLRQLHKEILALGPASRPQKIMFLYDPCMIERSLVARVVDEELKPDVLPVAVQIVSAEGLGYYEMKNHAAALRDSEIIVFLDCDVIPEEGWLDAILAPFEMPGVRIVAGATHIDHSDLYGKAAAIFWAYPLRDATDDLRATGVYYANNLAVRRKFFTRNPFPECRGFRMQAAVFRSALQEKGIGVPIQKSARVTHPAPTGFRHFAAHALQDGRDAVLLATTVDQFKHHRPLRQIFKDYRWSLGETVRNFRKYRRKLGLGPLSAIAALTLGMCFHTIKAIGAVISVFYPDLLMFLLSLDRKIRRAPAR